MSPIYITANSILWFISLGFLVYATGMLFVAFAWQQFLIALAFFFFETALEIILGAFTGH